MAYTPIASTSSRSDNSSTSVPQKDTRRFFFASRGVSGLYSDYTSVIAQSGDFTKIVGTSVLLNSITNLLNTPTGSYIFDPEYGSDLYKLVFDPADGQTAELIRQEVVGKIKLYDSRIVILNVESIFFTNQKGFRLNVTIERNDTVSELSLDFSKESTFAIEEG